MIIIAHPFNIAKLRESLKEAVSEEEKSFGIFRDFNRIKFIADSNLPIEAEIGDWVRTNVLEDTPYVTWVEDIQNPPSWAIFFGLVRREKKSVFYKISEPSYSYAFDAINKSVKKQKQKMINKIEEKLWTEVCEENFIL